MMTARSEATPNRVRGRSQSMGSEGWGSSPSTQYPQPSDEGATLRGKDLCREVWRRTHDEAIAIAHCEQTPLVAVVGMDELGVPARRAEDSR